MNKVILSVLAGLCLIPVMAIYAARCPAPSEVVQNGQWKSAPGWSVQEKVGVPGGQATIDTVWIGRIVDMGPASFSQPEGPIGVICNYTGVSAAGTLSLVKIGNVKASGSHWTTFLGSEIYCTDGSNCSWE